MKTILRLSLLLVIILLFLTGCTPAAIQGEGLVIGDAYRLSSGQTLDHDLTVVGGNVSLEKDSIVNGDVAVIGGNVTIDGKINGDVSVIGGNTSLDDNAVIQGQVSSLGGTLRRSEKALVEGKTVQNKRQPGAITTLRAPGMQVSMDPITAPLMAIFQALALAALAVVANLFAARAMERTGRSAVAAPAASGGVGCLTIIVLVIMTITIILIPISLLGFLVGGVAVLFGFLSLGLILGRQLAVWLKQSWTDPVSAGVGTLVLSLLTSMLNLIPCIGWTATTLVWLVALGAAVLSRFGTQLYPSPYAVSPAAPAPYAPPVYSPEPGARVYSPESDRPAGPPPETPAE